MEIKKSLKKILGETPTKREVFAKQNDFTESLLKAQSDLEDGVAVINIKSRRFVYVNDALVRISGYSREELLGLRSFLRLVAKENISKVLVNLALSKAGKRLEKSYDEIVTVSKEGDRKIVEIAVRPIARDKNHLVVIARDITLRKKSEGMLKRWKDVFEHTSWGLVIGSPDGTKFEMMNAPFARMHGYSIEELMGKPIAMIFSEKSQEQFRRYLPVLRKKGQLIAESVNVRKDGSTFPAQIDIAAVRSPRGKIQYYIGNIRDLTRRKHVESELRQARAELEERVQKRTQELAEVNEILAKELQQREQAEEALKKSTAETNAILSSITDVYAKFDRQGRILDLNLQAERLIRRSREELLGKDFIREFPETQGNIFHTQFKLANKTRQPVHFEAYLEVVGKWFETHAYPSPEGIAVYLRDITERKIAEQNLQNKIEEIDRERAKDEAILDNIGDGIIATDETGKIIYANRTAGAIFGEDAEKLIGKNSVEAVPLVDQMGVSVPAKERPLVSVLKTKKKNISSKYCAVRKNGKVIPVLLTATPIILESRVIGAIGVYHDITKEREIDRAKSEFVALASHQLRTPLTITSWYTEKLLREGKENLSEKQKRYLDELYKANGRMIDLVNAVLDVSRLELGTITINPERIRLSEISDMTIAELMPTIKNKRLKLTRKYDPKLARINADPKLIKIVFQNLISNSVKYIDEGGKIDVIIEQDNEYAHIIVKDTGFGIPEEQQDKVFTKLFRADNAVERESDGTGLGLYIVKSIIDQTGGEIEFTSVEGEGTTFHVYLPLSGMIKRAGKASLKMS